MSLKEIAKMVGVSPSTVSRVLNNTSSTCASAEIKEKIFEAARTTGYVPNKNARDLRSLKAVQGETAFKAARHVSIVLARITDLKADPFFYELFRSLEINLMKSDTIIDRIVYAKDSERLPDDLKKSQGVIILGRCSDELLKEIKAVSRNIVGIWRNSMNFDVDEVVCDGMKAAELAMRHLISLGHKKIAYIGDCSYESRYVGYCNCLISNNIPMNYEWICHTDQTGSEGARAFEKLLAECDDFTAVLCANDITAIGVLDILKSRRRKTGRKISVISIDDIEASQETSPYLTTVHIPKDEMAHMAVMLLKDRIEKNHSEAVRIEFPCRIVNRSSCYPV